MHFQRHRRLHFGVGVTALSLLDINSKLIYLIFSPLSIATLKHFNILQTPKQNVWTWYKEQIPYTWKETAYMWQSQSDGAVETNSLYSYCITMMYDKGKWCGMEEGYTRVCLHMEPIGRTLCSPVVQVSKKEKKKTRLSPQNNITVNVLVSFCQKCVEDISKRGTEWYHPPLTPLSFKLPQTNILLLLLLQQHSFYCYFNPSDTSLAMTALVLWYKVLWLKLVEGNCTEAHSVCV